MSNLPKVRGFSSDVDVRFPESDKVPAEIRTWWISTRENLERLKDKIELNLREGTGVGPQGAQGPRGFPGTAVNQGAQGSQGPIGPQGPQGPPGSGEQGDQGTQGTQGSQGEQGDQGAQGSTGSQGSQGFQGDTGPQGASGGGAGATRIGELTDVEDTAYADNSILQFDQATNLWVSRANDEFFDGSIDGGFPDTVHIDILDIDGGRAA